MQLETVKWAEKCAKSAGDASVSRLSGTDVAALLAERADLLEACKGREVDLQELRNLCDGTIEDSNELQRAFNIIDGALNSLRVAIAKAEASNA